MYLYEVRMRRIIARRSDQRCAAIRSALAQRAKRSQQSHRLCEVLQPLTRRFDSCLRFSFLNPE